MVTDKMVTFQDTQKFNISLGDYKVVFNHKANWVSLKSQNEIKALRRFAKTLIAICDAFERRI